MRSRPHILLLLIAAISAMPSCAIQKSTVSVASGKSFTLLGMGDSITEGGPDFFSYLFPLDSMLTANGYKPVFIGPRTSHLQGDSLHHAGYSGRTAEYLAARADSIYSLYPANLVLLHAGHNHFVEEAPVKSIIEAQRKIIRTIRSRNNKAVILVAAVITSGKLPKYDYIPGLNEQIKALVTSFNDKGILFVDQRRDWDWTIFTIGDKVHPNKAGARLIAQHWYETIVNLKDLKL